MQILRQSTATQAILLGPFLDSTNGDDEEIALTIANTDIRISKNGAAAVAKNSGGATHDADGMYAATLDATDTNTVGRLTLYVHVAGALFVRHEYQVIEEAVYDILYAAAATGAVPVASIAANAITAAAIAADAITAAKIADNAIGALELAADAATEIGTAVWAAATRTLSSAANITSTGGTTVPQTGDAYARLGAPVAASISADIQVTDTVADAIKAKTDSLTFTVAGDVDANVQTWLGSAASALETAATVRAEMDANSTRLATLAGGIIEGLAQTGTLSTTACTSDLTGYVNDELIGRTIVFTGGAADGQAATITDYASASGLVTFSGGIITPPINNDPFKIV